MTTEPASPTTDRDGLVWRTSSYSSALGNCVQIAALPGARTAVRDSRDQAGPVLMFSNAVWQEFCAAIKTGGSGPA